MAFECAFTGREIVEYYDPYFAQLAWESQYLEVKSKNTHFILRYTEFR